MTLFFYDCEFIERGPGYPIDLISIGIVSEDDHELYLCNFDCDLSVANDWVKANVIPNLPPKPSELKEAGQVITPELRKECLRWKTRKQIANAIVEFLELDRGNTPELWGEYSSYDHVCLAQIFGTMMDLPKGCPMRTRDVIQWSEDCLGIPESELPPSLEVNGNHNALLGARSVRAKWDYLYSRTIPLSCQACIPIEMLTEVPDTCDRCGVSKDAIEWDSTVGVWVCSVCGAVFEGIRSP